MARVTVDETTMGVHQFTIDWWRQLPEEFRKADRAQGAYLAPAWDGLNADPRFVTGFDGWDRSNTSDKDPYIASVAFSRAFEVTPGVPVLIRSWHTPRRTDTGTLDSVTVTHTVRNYTGAVVATRRATITTPQGYVDTWVTPDRLGRIHITVDVAIAVPYSMDAVGAIHVGTRKVSFDELPDLVSFTVHKPYPLLRFMDGIGHQAGWLRDEARHMWAGDTVNPVTAPEAWLPFLAAMLGLPPTYVGRLTPAQLRSHLVAFVEQGRPPIGSRRNIAEVAKQWLTGGKQVTVIPATQLPSWNGGEDKQLLQAVKGATASGRVIVAPTPPVPDVEYQWTGARGASPSIMLTAGSQTGENREPNPRFEKDLSGWSIARGTAKRDTSIYQTAGASAGILPSTDSGAGWYFIADARAYQQATTVTTTMWVYSQVRRSVAVRVWGYDGASTTQGDTISLTPNTWTPITITYPVTPTCTYRPGLVPAAGDENHSPIWVDRIYTARADYDRGTYFDGDTTDSATNDLWVRPGSPNTVYVWDAQARWTPKTGVTQGLIDAVVDAKRGVRSVYTLLMFVRADELPNRDLPAFQKFMQNSGVIPAGHRLVCLESRPTWDQWENAVGPTWTDLESRTKTWTDSESAGVTLDY